MLLVYTILLPEHRKESFTTHFAEFLRTGYIEVESRWKKSSGELIDVWVTGNYAYVSARERLLKSQALPRHRARHRALPAAQSSAA